MLESNLSTTGGSSGKGQSSQRKEPMKGDGALLGCVEGGGFFETLGERTRQIRRESKFPKRTD